MEYRQVGKSGLRVSSIGLGAWLTFGDQVPERDAIELVAAALAQGVNFIDTADVYANGRAEQVVGKAIRGKARHKLVLSSKVYWPMSNDINDRGLSRKHIMESVEGSLRRLGVDYLDIYFCHRFDPDTPLDETVRAMDDLVRQGKILYWGTSVWSPTQLGAAHAIATERGYDHPVVEQPRYNLLDRHVEDGILAAARQHGMGVFAWSPLAGGVLTGKYNDGIPEGSRASETYWCEETLTEDNLAKVRKLSRMAEALELAPEKLALTWLVQRPNVTCAIIGARTRAQLESNLKAAEMTLDSGTLATLDAIFSGVGADTLTT